MEMDFEYIAHRLQCSYSEKLECVVTLKQILYIADEIRKYGSYFDKNQLDFDNFPTLLKKGIELLSNSVEYDILKEILYTYIMCGNYRGKEFLKNILIADGILSIAESINPQTVKYILLSYFGEDKYLIDSQLIDSQLDEIKSNHLSKSEVDKLLSEKGE